MATGKHFVGYSLSQGGMNCAPVHMGRRELWEIYVAPSRLSSGMPICTPS